MLLYQILAYTIHGKIQKSHTKKIKLKYQLQRGMINLNYLMHHILCSPIRVYVNKIETRITFKIKTGYFVEILKYDYLEALKIK